MELPPLPLTERGSMLQVSHLRQLEKIRNNGENITQHLKRLKARYKTFPISPDSDPDVFAKRKSMLKQIDRIFKRIDNGRIFPLARWTLSLRH